MFDHFFKPFSVIGKLLFEQRLTKTITIILLIIFGTTAISIIIYARVFTQSKTSADFLTNSLLPLVAFPTLVIVLSYVQYKLPILSQDVDIQLEKLREERVEITQKIENEQEPDIFHTIQLSLNQLNEYYTINKGQARNSFRISIAAIVTGLTTLTFGVWWFFFHPADSQVAILATASSVLLEFIGGAYFYMYKKSLDQVNFFFGQLIKIQDTMLAINLVDGVESDDKNAELTEKIVVSLLERSLK